jgi:hypothetical protein
MADGKDLLIAYAQRFADAQNTIVSTMYGLAFAVYAILAASEKLRDKLQQYFWILLPIVIVSNPLLFLVLVRLRIGERRITKALHPDPELLKALREAWRVRIELFWFNFALYVLVIGLIYKLNPRNRTYDEVNGSGKRMTITWFR